MEALKVWLHRRYETVVSSIAFWPTVLGTLFFLLAVVMRTFTTKAFFIAVDETIPYLLVRDRNVALSLLTTLIGGLISLMVFSFSMVMVLLSNATANLSPRLLPSLIGSRRHQMVLGFYLGSILYCIIIAMGFGLNAKDSAPPSTSLALAVIFGIVCLALFIYFIHGVSMSIQVGVVLRGAHRRTLVSLDRLLKRQAEQKPGQHLPDVGAWTCVPAWEAGFFRGINEAGLAAFAKTHHTRFAFMISLGTYVVEGDPLFYSELPLAKGFMDIDHFPRNFYFEEISDTDDFYGYGVENILEVALKALSPGINDPGTAMIAIDYLRQIFHRAVRLVPVITKADEDGVPRVFQALEDPLEFLDRQIVAIQAYGKEDPMTQTALRRMRDSLLREAAQRAWPIHRLEALGLIFASVQPPQHRKPPQP